MAWLEASAPDSPLSTFTVPWPSVRRLEDDTLRGFDGSTEAVSVVLATSIVLELSQEGAELRIYPDIFA